jgi:GMP synthase (glutamine-hydrolysing)
MERAMGVPVQLVHYTEFSKEWTTKAGIRALIISGNSADWWEYDWAEFEPLQAVIRSAEMPVMGLFGGHQFIVFTLGGECGLMGTLKPGEEDTAPGFQPGMLKEYGFLPVRIVRPDSLLQGLPSPFTVREAHYWEVKRLPPGFEVLAETDACSVQMIRHAEKPWCGTQFHPECSNNEHPDGARILYNFYRTYGLD